MLSIEDRIQQALPSFMPGASLLKTWTLKGGISATMTAFEVQVPGEAPRKLIARQPGPWRVRENPNAVELEYRVLQAVYELGLPVQQPYYLEPLAPENTLPFYVVEFVEGEPDVSPINSDQFLQRYVDGLVAIHRVDWHQGSLEHLPRQTRAIWGASENLNEALREPEIRPVLAHYPPYLESNPRVLRHGDYWPGNILWRDGEIAAIIDWEEAKIGEPLMDLAICRLDILWILGPDAMQTMTDLYQAEMNLDLSDLPFWDLCASLRPVSNLQEWADSYPHLGRPDVTLESMTRDHQWFVDQALASRR